MYKSAPSYWPKSTYSNRPGPFSLLIEGGPPDYPFRPEDKSTLAFRHDLIRKLDFKYHAYTIGQLVTSLCSGRQQHLPDNPVLVEPVPGHGVTFHDPDFLLDYHGVSNLIYAMRDLVVSISEATEEQ